MRVGSRLDHPGSLHHVMGHGVGDEYVLGTDADKGSFLARMDFLGPSMDFRVYAWALMPSHYHLLIEVGSHKLHEIMHRLLGGFSKSYNRRHGHRGHVFMSRFKSILVCKDEYLYELIRYINLNPLRAGLVDNLSDLADYPWTGHRAMIHGAEHLWHDVNAVLGAFGMDADSSRGAYLSYLSSGIADGESDLLESGNLRIGRSGVVVEKGARSDQRRYDYVGTVLGSREFAVESALILDDRRRQTRSRGHEHEEVEAIIERVCELYGIDCIRLKGRSKGGAASKARITAARLLFEAGISRADISRRLNLAPSTITRLLSVKP